MNQKKYCVHISREGRRKKRRTRSRSENELARMEFGCRHSIFAAMKVSRQCRFFLKYFFIVPLVCVISQFIIFYHPTFFFNVFVQATSIEFFSHYFLQLIYLHTISIILIILFLEMPSTKVRNGIQKKGFSFLFMIRDWNSILFPYLEKKYPLKIPHYWITQWINVK